MLVNVVAKDRHGKPVADLSRDDFVLRDNGQEQRIALFIDQTVFTTPVGALDDQTPPGVVNVASH